MRLPPAQRHPVPASGAGCGSDGYLKLKGFGFRACIQDFGIRVSSSGSVLGRFQVQGSKRGLSHHLTLLLTCSVGGLRK